MRLALLTAVGLLLLLSLASVASASYGLPDTPLSSTHRPAMAPAGFEPATSRP